MAMFHVAMPADNHPTRLLLNKLIDAKKRGVEVRVLLDRDRKEDIFKSTIINLNALETLKANGIDARFDTEDKLLHSKFLVLDSKIAIVGSHNWSAGSYFNYDDMTMVINSENFAQELRQRFEKLWAATE
jgi:phosphatidylserine/phosphatidylglycerophosphate/cardiolipin synthase-like enzyme